MFDASRFRLLGGIILALAILSYAGAKSINLARGPVLTIDSPVNGEMLRDSLITISGNAQNIAFLTLNDRQIFVDDTGKIFDQLLAYEGYNIITVKATDKFGREEKVTREFIYKPAQNFETN